MRTTAQPIGETGQDRENERKGDRATWFSLAIAAGIVLLLGAALVQAQDFTDSARQMPMVVGVPTFTLALVALVVEAVKVWRGRAAPDHDRVPTGARALVRVLLVFVGLAVSYLVLGFPWGAALFLFGFLVSSRRVGVVKSALITAAVIVPTYFVFVVQLGIPAFSGLAGL